MSYDFIFLSKDFFIFSILSNSLGIFFIHFLGSHLDFIIVYTFPLFYLFLLFIGKLFFIVSIILLSTIPNLLFDDISAL